jgi:uncharacterized protein
VIVVDTGALLALLDASDRHHDAMVELFDRTSDEWVLPWAILPEVDYLVTRHGGSAASHAFLADLAAGAWAVEWGEDSDIVEAREILTRYSDLPLGLVDAVVMATAQRLRARAIATLDLRHFAAVTLEGNPRLLPRDA